VAGLFWEKSTVGWWRISQINRALVCCLFMVEWLLQGLRYSPYMVGANTLK
jgi:hypothetical protein